MIKFISVIMLIQIAASADATVVKWNVLTREETKKWIGIIRGQFDSDRLYVTYDMHSFSDSSSSQFIDAESGEAVVVGSRSWSTLMNMETFCDEKYSVTLDHEDRAILVADAGNESVPVSGMKWVDGLPESYQVLYRNVGDMTWLRFQYPEGGDFRACEVLLDAGKRVKKSICYFGVPVTWDFMSGGARPELPKIEIVYTLISTDVKIHESKLDFSRIVSISGRDITPLGKYVHYAVIDTRGQLSKK